MNDAQKRFADADPVLGHLLTQIDTFYQELPQAVRDAYDRMGAEPVRSDFINDDGGSRAGSCNY